jgi:predicted nucleotidyltransferase
MYQRHCAGRAHPFRSLRVAEDRGLRYDVYMSRPEIKRATAISRSDGKLKKPSATANFTILIGSRARRTDDRQSDIDIVRIGHRDVTAVQCKGSRKIRDVSYIDYDAEKFSQLYDDGSLFLYHIFSEGRLLSGDERAWTSLRTNFRVRTNFRREIAENREVLAWLQDGNQFEGATIPYLAHTCRALKNLAIFSLAQGRSYIFDKRTALRRAFPELKDEAINLLIVANNVFERVHVDFGDLDRVNGETIRCLRKQVARAIGHPDKHAYH